MSLYQITAEMRELSEALGAADPACPETESALREHGASLADAFDTKAESYACLISNLEAQAVSRRKEADRLGDLADSDMSTATRLRKMLLEAMIATGRTKFESKLFRFGVQKNGGAIPVVVTDETALPANFLIPKVTHAVDKESIRIALERGVPVPGAVLGERGVRLVIR